MSGQLNAGMEPEPTGRVSFVVRVLGNGGSERLVFLGTGMVIGPRHVLTCRHVVLETAPFGQLTNAAYPTLLIELPDDRRISVRSPLIDQARDLALLELVEPIDADIPPFLSNLTQAIESKLRSSSLIAYGYAQSGQDGELWHHHVSNLALLPSYRKDAETMAQLQLSGGLPIGTSGGPVLLHSGSKFYFLGTVYLGGERSATSRLIMADSVAEFLDDHGLLNVQCVDFGKTLAPGRLSKLGSSLNRTWAWKIPALTIGIALFVSAYSYFGVDQVPTIELTELASESKMVLPLPDEPSVVVLPFHNLSGDQEHEYFARGLVETLSTDLSKIAGLFIVAQAAVSAQGNVPLSIKRAAEELGVRYVLQGSMQRSDQQLRINIKLIDSLNGSQLWAERYDGTIQDVFELQDRVTFGVAEALNVRVSSAERGAVSTGATTSASAYDWFLKGTDRLRDRVPERLAEAANALESAIQIDPGYGNAHAALAETYWESAKNNSFKELGLASPPVARLEAGRRLNSALRHPTALAHRVASDWHLSYRRHSEAVGEAERSLALDPNDPEAHIALARSLIFTGRPEEALPHIEQAMRLNPRFSVIVSDKVVQATTTAPASYLVTLGLANLGLERFETAATLFERALDQNPQIYVAAGPLAATYAHLGRLEEAQNALERLQKGRRLSLGRDAEISDELNAWPYRLSKDITRLQEGLRRAGLA